MQRTGPYITRVLRQCRPYSHSTRLSLSIRRILPQTQTITRTQFQRSNFPSLRNSSSLTIPESEQQQESERPPHPSYQLTFTCKPCKHRSAHRVTKQGYHHGTVLITCPNCKNRHVISDHLKIFMDEASTLEDILKRTAGTDQDLSKLLKKGRLGQREGQMIGNEDEQDLEFWEDGTTTKHTPGEA